MSLKCTIYISDVNNLTDARYCAGMMVDYIGFNLDENAEKHLSDEDFKQITSWIEGVKIVGEFYNFNVNYINSKIEKLGLKYVALHTFEIEKLSEINAECILFTNEILNTNNLIITDVGNSTITQKRLLSGVIKSNEIEKFLQQENVVGFCLKGGQEIKPGLKDFDELAEILELLENN